jgi:hypothetical protein
MSPLLARYILPRNGLDSERWTMLAAFYDRQGPPSEVLQVGDLPEP